MKKALPVILIGLVFAILIGFCLVGITLEPGSAGWKTWTTIALCGAQLIVVLFLAGVPFAFWLAHEQKKAGR